MGQDGQAGEALDGVGVPDGQPQEEAADGSQSQDPLYVQKRLKQQKRAHEREMREMQARMADMQSRLPQQQSTQQMPMNPYAQQVQPGSVEDSIQKAVSFALNHKDQEERRAKEAQQAMHVQKQYQQLHKHLDSMGDKYDDFHDVVLGEDARFTPAMRDYSMTLPKTGSGSAGEVLYKLGKNPSELERIANLHPLDQASEMSRLSHALISGGESKGSAPRPLGQIKSNPVSNSHAVTEKTPIGSIRERMKSGSWK